MTPEIIAELSKGIYLLWVVMFFMVVARIAESIQNRRERKREKLDLPKLYIAVKEHKRRQGQSRRN